MHSLPFRVLGRLCIPRSTVITTVDRNYYSTPCTDTREVLLVSVLLVSLLFVPLNMFVSKDTHIGVRLELSSGMLQTVG